KYDPTFMADHGGLRGMAFSADGKLLAGCGITDVSNAFAGVGKPLVVLFDWQAGKRTLLRPKEDFTGTAWGMIFHPSGFLAAAGAVLPCGSMSCFLIVWNGNQLHDPGWPIRQAFTFLGYHYRLQLQQSVLRGLEPPELAIFRPSTNLRVQIQWTFRNKGHTD